MSAAWLQKSPAAGADAGDLEVAALDEPERAVELRPVLALVGIRARAAQEDPADAGGGDEQQGEDGALHGPSGTSDASQGKSALGL